MVPKREDREDGGSENGKIRKSRKDRGFKKVNIGGKLVASLLFSWNRLAPESHDLQYAHR